jgi:hypothetical protein
MRVSRKVSAAAAAASRQRGARIESGDGGDAAGEGEGEKSESEKLAHVSLHELSCRKSAALLLAVLCTRDFYHSLAERSTAAVLICCDLAIHPSRRGLSLF